MNGKETPPITAHRWRVRPGHAEDYSFLVPGHCYAVELVWSPDGATYKPNVLRVLDEDGEPLGEVLRRCLEQCSQETSSEGVTRQ